MCVYVTQYRIDMFEPFSRGYYMGRLYLEPSAGERTTMCKRQHEQLNEALYADGAGLERLDRPLIIKVGDSHLPVHGEEGVPADTLSVPESLLEAASVRNPPTLREVLLAKADRASQLLAYAGSGG